MANKTKKRPQEPLPDRATAPKRARTHSMRVSGAKMQQEQDRASSLPTGEDWAFRIRLISSATDLDDDIFRDAVRGLVRMCFPKGIFEQLGPHVVSCDMRKENASRENIQRMSDVFVPEMLEHLTDMLSAYLRNVESSDCSVEDSTSTPKAVLPGPKDKKVSSSWAWDIDPADVTDEAVNAAFLRTADLFAYHTLPITKRKLGSKASKKEMRHEMQSILDGMPQHEFDKWTERLEKLINGDRTMLVRPELPISDNNARDSEPSTSTIGNDFGLGYNIVMKGEAAEVTTAQASGHDAVAQATTFLRRSPTEDRAVEHPVLSVSAAFRGHAGYFHSSEYLDSPFGAPILRLLLGSNTLTLGHCVNNFMDITETVMRSLERRVPGQSVVRNYPDGQNTRYTKAELRESIIGAFPKPGQHFSLMEIKKDIESSLVHWVIARLTAFPELKAMPFVFAHTMPAKSVVVSLLFRNWPAVSRLRGSEVWEKILIAMQRRGISEELIGEAHVDCLQIENICNNRQYPDTAWRIRMERILRGVVFLHRDKFPELRYTRVVKMWEKKTSLTW